MRAVDALDAQRLPRQAQQGPQPFQQHLRPPLGQTRLQQEVGAALRHLHPPELAAFARVPQTHGVARQAAQPSHQRPSRARLAGDQDPVRDLSPRGVNLFQEALQRLVQLRGLQILQLDPMLPTQQAASERQQHDTAQTPLAGGGGHVHVQRMRAGGLLPPEQPLQSVKLVPQLGRPFVFHLLGGRGHAQPDLLEQTIVLATQELDGLLHQAAVLLGLDAAGAGRVAAAHPVVPARLARPASDPDRPLAQAEVPVNRVLDQDQRGFRPVRPEIGRAVFQRLLGDLQTRERLVRGQPQVHVWPLELHGDVERRPVGADQVRLVRQGGLFGKRRDHLDRCGRPDQLRQASRAAPAPHVPGHAPAQVLRLADIKQRAPTVTKQVYARLVRKLAQPLEGQHAS